ncbi:hypothetical protein [Amphritea balenae]|uniref:Uncharacterized protein n=1 Tax=Amphritea balenae TaxID=452629 RepID=A0A3P1ST68_9GAMM|nr:hypothetical protein [Amphritea balenae]RRD00387.1 hypothetical protein EHS89_04645 [Amphritea balenae]GGK85873.1 hypothetical protein GCM10007941_40450 [Amphritea balenae]
MIGSHTKIINFWQQVEQTIDRLLNSEAENQFDNESLLLEYSNSLRNIDSNLTFHFEREEGEGAVEMIFGCDGYPESITSVLSLVGAAPDIGGIRFVAFNHRYDPVPTCVNLGDEQIEIEAFWFGYRIEAGRYHLDIYMQDLPKALDMEPRIEAVMIYLDALIGEYDLMTRVSTLSWYELPVDPTDFGLQLLPELRDCFDQQRHQIEAIGITYH